MPNRKRFSYSRGLM